MSFIGDREKKYPIGPTKGDNDNNGVVDLREIYERVKLKKLAKEIQETEVRQ